MHVWTRDEDTEKQQEKAQVCENHSVRRIAIVKRVGKRRIEKLMKDGVYESFKK